MNLVEKLRKSREQVVEVGGFKFTIRRPTDVEMMELGRSGPITRLLPFIVGWDGVKELDIIPGGDPHPVPFDAEVCREWLTDRPDLLGPVIEAITSSYTAHRESIEEKAKN